MRVLANRTRTQENSDGDQDEHEDGQSQGIQDQGAKPNPTTTARHDPQEPLDRTLQPPRPTLSDCLDAAARVLTDAGRADDLPRPHRGHGTRGLWTSPGGQTPHATLYSALLREINTKGDNARFVKVDRGRFAAR